MAVFRSDQAQITFAAEAAQGGDAERLGGTVTATSYLSLSVVAGVTSIAVAAGTNYVVGDFIRIGDTGAAANSEVRRVEYKDGNILHLDRPLGFNHTGCSDSDASGVDRLTGASTDYPNTTGRKYITFLPGIYETVDVPDPEMAIEPRYFLGTQSKRNFFQAYKGQHSFTGAVGDMILLNGWPLRFPIGGVVTVPHATTMSNAINSTAMTVSSTVAVNKGDVFLTPAANYTSTVSHGDYIVMDYSAANSSAGEPATKSEVRRVVTSAAGYMEVDYPFQFAHAVSTAFRKLDPTAAGFFYRHHIVETVDLDTISWHVHMRDSGETAANDFDRRYVGGMVGAMTISAEEGGLLTVGWDGVPFMDMVHNQKKHNGVNGNYGSGSLSDSHANDMPGFALMQSITADDVNKLPSGTANLDLIADNTASTAVTEPYYYSRGEVKFLGTTFARIRSFTLNIGNNEEPRYYIQPRFGRHRGPTEIRENQREYTMSASLALPDTGNAKTTTAIDSATSLFKELLLEGDYGSDLNPAMKGFTVSLEFTRGTNDRITIDMPGLAPGATSFGTPGTPITAGEGGNAQGVFIRTAPHGITGDNPLQTDVDMLIRNMKITVEDNIAVYP